MPPDSLVHVFPANRLQQLKCDETQPSCLQCKKRNRTCPGYEKTLKWSTKYEVFQPFHFESPDPASRAAPTAPTAPTAPAVSDVTLPPDVASGFEALAAVLPIGKRKPESETDRRDSTSPAALPTATDTPDPVVQEVSSEDGVSPQDTEATSIDIADVIDPMLMNDFIDATDMFDQDFPLDPTENFDTLEPEALDDLELDIEEVPRLIEESTSTELSSPRLSRSLLLDYYRLPSPSPASSLDDIESILVQHYFKDVCVCFSSFDSVLNPFRTTIGRIFQESSSIYYAIQSMAAAHLANTFPNMTAVGIEMQRKACDSLQAELPLVQSGQMSGTTSFLTIILLGLTTSWHESNALGEEFLTTARSLILPKLLCSPEREEVQRETQFFEESLIYWEMLMGFVTQDAMTFSPGSVLRSRAPKGAAPVARNKEGKIVPHPWTGIAPRIQMLFAEVGRVVRRERLLQVSGATDFRRRQDNLLNATTLEEDLLAAEYPGEDELADPGDERTAKHDFIVMAEVYRCTGLLELYRVFPSILRKRLGRDKCTWADKVQFEFPMPRFETPYEDTDTKLWINSLALHILGALESLPSSSGTCCLQPILLVAAASELKFVSSVDYFDIYANDARVLQAREFADRRLNEYALRLPAKPLRTMIELVKEVWRRLDDGQNAFWIDVMVEKGWHTVMG